MPTTIMTASTSSCNTLQVEMSVSGSASSLIKTKRWCVVYSRPSMMCWSIAMDSIWCISISNLRIFWWLLTMGYQLWRSWMSVWADLLGATWCKWDRIHYIFKHLKCWQGKFSTSLLIIGLLGSSPIYCNSHGYLGFVENCHIEATNRILGRRYNVVRSSTSNKTGNIYRVQPETSWSTFFRLT